MRTILEVNPEKAKKNYEELKKELPNAVIAYALKANYDPRILKTLSKAGCGAEVCSEYEYRLAKRKGFEKIIINGYVKPMNCWLQNVEETGLKIKGLKGARIKPFNTSKLGLSEEEILKKEWDCIAYHSSRTSINEWKKILEKARKLTRKTGAELIDAGGGLTTERIKLLKKIDNLIIEPGRALVENTCTLKTRVLAVKDENVIIDTGLNFFNKLSMSNYQVEVKGKENKKKSRAYRVCGPVPTDLDNIGKHNLPLVKKNDTLIIKNCGAYTTSMASNWTRKKPVPKYI
ncbi:hypothetical protein GF352_00730 [archaeon]|nr:hypothetical protein [archaeon]